MNTQIVETETKVEVPSRSIEPAEFDEADVASHPMTKILCLYYGEYERLREDNEDLDNLNFHKQYGLRLGVPFSWPLVSSIKHLIQTSPRDRLAVIYPSTDSYREIHSALDSIEDEIEVKFFSWQELYVAMDRAGKDARELQKFRHILQSANLTIFLGAPLGIPEVVDQVRGFCEGCLIVVQ